MHKLEELCYMLEDEIGRITQKGEILPNEWDNLYKAVKSLYYIKVIKAMEEAKQDYGYSGRRMSISYDGRPYFDNENSYAGYSTRGRDSMGRYTRDGGYSMDNKEEMRRHLEQAMNMATTESERNNLREMLNNL